MFERKGFQPRTADTAPRYCPSGKANAKAALDEFRAELKKVAAETKK